MCFAQRIAESRQRRRPALHIARDPIVPDPGSYPCGGGERILSLAQGRSRIARERLEGGDLVVTHELPGTP